jgi:hypothetical protein
METIKKLFEQSSSDIHKVFFHIISKGSFAYSNWVSQQENPITATAGCDNVFITHISAILLIYSDVIAGPLTFARPLHKGIAGISWFRK